MSQTRVVPRERYVERGRTKGGKVEADTGAYVEACHAGDGTANTEWIIRHWGLPAANGVHRTVTLRVRKRRRDFEAIVPRL